MRRALWILCLGLAAAALGLGREQASEFVVTLNNGQSISRLNADSGTTVVRSLAGRSTYLVRGAGDPAAVLDKLQKNHSVASAEVNAVIRLANTDPPSFAGLGGETLYLLDWQSTTNFHGVEVAKAYVDQPALTIIEAAGAQTIGTGTGARVAIIDTGVDPFHPALRPWLDSGVDLVRGVSASEWDGLSGETLYLLDTDNAYLLVGETAYLLDRRFLFLPNQSLGSYWSASLNGADFPPAFGHGTMVAGAVHAVAPEARIVPIKAFDAYGRTNVFRLIEGVYDAIDLGADVINMSFSTEQDSPALRKAINAAQAVGIATVASAGNDGQQSRTVFPASYPGAYGVAASDFNDRLASFSNFGKSVSIVAPGAFIVSTAPGGRYAAAWGTSFSAPLVSGGIALLASLHPSGHSDSPQVMNTADSIDAVNPEFAKQLGKGRLNLRRAVTRKR